MKIVKKEIQINQKKEIEAICCDYCDFYVEKDKKYATYDQINQIDFHEWFYHEIKNVKSMTLEDNPMKWTGLDGSEKMAYQQNYALYYIDSLTIAHRFRRFGRYENLSMTTEFLNESDTKKQYEGPGWYFVIHDNCEYDGETIDRNTIMSLDETQRKLSIDVQNLENRLSKINNFIKYDDRYENKM
jgi:hypothetical protein